ncbi:MAG: hypothetical protein IKJ32_05870 [Clostridia bacterium]|nr:hypothetical protein [Clostridia bacterium]
MPSCLGIYTDRNMIKYAKVTSVTEKIAGQILTLDAYGVKFYDNLQATIDEIAEEVGMSAPATPGQITLSSNNATSVALALSNEEFYITDVFANLKKKDMHQLILSEYQEKMGENALSSSVMEMRVKLALNSGSIDKHLAICAMTSTGELANIRRNYEKYKVDSICPLSISVKNLFENQGIDEEAIVVNIEDKTTITVFHRSEIQYVTSLPLGTQEIISKLAEKYNSASKAYEALKKVSAYIEDSYDMDDESRNILDVVIPVLYDIRQQVDAIVTPYLKDAKAIYITGAGAVINNIDLYFGEVFLDTPCKILKPFFAGRDSENMKEIIEVNSAIALALDGVGMSDKDLNFIAASKKAANLQGAKVVTDKIKAFDIKGRIKNAKVAAGDFIKKLNAPIGSKKKKRNVDFDESLLDEAGDGEITDTSYGRIDSILTKTTVFVASLLIGYIVAGTMINNRILAKDKEVNSEISKVNAAIAKADEDATYLKGRADEYVAITEKLSAIITKINKESRKTYNVPNFMSKLMFIMPAGVKVTSINVLETGDVSLRAESGQYAQLGFLVSRIKLEKALVDVDMEVVSVDGNIKIIVSGVLP